MELLQKFTFLPICHRFVASPSDSLFPLHRITLRAEDKAILLYESRRARMTTQTGSVDPAGALKQRQATHQRPRDRPETAKNDEPVWPLGPAAANPRPP